MDKAKPTPVWVFAFAFIVCFFAGIGMGGLSGYAVGVATTYHSASLEFERYVKAQADLMGLGDEDKKKTDGP